MPRDSLATIIKVRRLACEDATRRLSRALADENRAERGFREIERTIADEMSAASDLEGSDALVEAFGAWLPTARQQLEKARRVLADRQAETVRVRADLTASRTALDSVEMLQRKRRAAARLELERAEAREIDDRPRRSDVTEE